MKGYDIAPLLQTLKEREAVFICGPRYDDNHLRVYAHGGFLCGLPASLTAQPHPSARITMLDPKYIKDDPALVASLASLKGTDNEAREKFLRKHLDILMQAAKNRFTSEPEESAEETAEERRQQTLISRDHTDFLRHNGTVVCDFQSSLPKAWRQPQMGRPAFDMVTFSINQAGRGVFTLVELKCAASTCGGSSGLKTHAEDMYGCVKANLTEYKGELLRRLDFMRRYDLLQNPPAGLDVILRRPKDAVLQAAFLFTEGRGLKGRDDMIRQCASYIPEGEELHRSNFLYQFAGGPGDVDLSDMKPWEDPSGGQDRL